MLTKNINLINQFLYDNSQSKLNSNSSFVENIKIDNTYYSIVFISVENFENQNIGYISFYQEENEINEIYTQNRIIKHFLFAFWILSISIIVYIQINRQKYYELSIQDYLTKINNYRGFMQKAKIIFENSKRYGAFNLCFIDINDFKSINDTFGHDTGDQVLITVAKIIKSSFRSSDIVGRLGGDEFAVCGISDPGYENIFTNRLHTNINKFNENHNKNNDISVSIGCVEIKKFDEITLEEVLAKADRLMYKNKNRLM